MLQAAQNDLKNVQAAAKKAKAKAKGKAAVVTKEGGEDKDGAIDPEEDAIQAEETKEKATPKAKGKARAKSSSKKEAAPKAEATPKVKAKASPRQGSAEGESRKRKYDVVIQQFKTCQIVPYGSRNEAGLKLKPDYVLEDKKIQATHHENKLLVSFLFRLNRAESLRLKSLS